MPFPFLEAVKPPGPVLARGCRSLTHPGLLAFYLHSLAKVLQNLTSDVQVSSADTLIPIKASCIPLLPRREHSQVWLKFPPKSLLRPVGLSPAHTTEATGEHF